MHVHLIAVAGTGMGSLAGLLKALGHDVSGSDATFDPPMGPALQAWGVRLMKGFDPSHLSPRPDLVIVGNVCRRDNPEARAAIDGGMQVTDMAHALAQCVLEDTSPLVVAGTHGKTTTTALCAWLLHDAGKHPGFLIGGLPKNFSNSFASPGQKRSLRSLPIVMTEAKAAIGPSRKTPFVVEGDEYDTAFFEKTPKFWHYRPEVAIVTSIEHDHIDIYPTQASYVDAFEQFVCLIPSHGLIVAAAHDPCVVDVVNRCANCEVAWYALQGDDTHGMSPHWLGAPLPGDDDCVLSFDLYAGGVASGRFVTNMPGLHNVRNAIASLAASAQGYGAALNVLRGSLAKFQGVKRRQDLLGAPRGISVYDDFAHHPTAVAETLRALRGRHPRGTLFAVFEPRSATACRSMHQQAYVSAFDDADEVLLAPLGRHTIPESERLDVHKLALDIKARGTLARALDGVDEIVEVLLEQARPGDVIALLSNGVFGGIHGRLMKELAT